MRIILHQLRNLIREEYKRIIGESTGTLGEFYLESSSTVARKKGQYELSRDFDLRISPDLLAIMSDPDPDAAITGISSGEHLITINVVDFYSRPNRRSHDIGSRFAFPDYGDEEIEWIPATIDGIALSNEDAKRLGEFLNWKLTDAEREYITEIENDL